MKWDEVARRIIQFQMGDTPGPYHLGLEIAMGCNLRCPFCQTPSVTPLPLDRALSYERWLRVVDESVELGCREFTVSGSGEPFTVPWAMDLMEHIKAKGARGTLITNGTLVTGEDAARLARIGWDVVYISLDSPREDIHDSLRGPGAYRGALRAADFLKAARKMVGTKKPVTGLNVLISSALLTESGERGETTVMEELVLLAKEHGVQELTFSPLVPHNSVPPQLYVRKEDLEKVRTGLQRFVLGSGLSTNAEYYIEGPERALSRDRRPELMSLHGPADIRGAFCYRPFYSMEIRPDGQVAPCCLIDEGIVVPPGGKGRIGAVLGDGTVEQVWRGPFFRELRARVLYELPGSFCRSCEPGALHERKLIRRELDALFPYLVHAHRLRQSERAHLWMERFRRSRLYRAII